MTTSACSGVIDNVEQTLFLGCSIIDFNANLGWGNDASSLTVNLVRDTSDHPKDPSVLDFWNNLKLIAQETPNPPQTKDFHKNIIKNMDHTYQRDIQPLPQATGKVVFNAQTNLKRYWFSEDPGFMASTGTLWQPDSSKSYSIDGVPVLFGYGNNFRFGGIISKWTENISNAGQKYTVEIKSFSSLLSDCWLIVGHYIGSIANIIPDTVVQGIRNVSCPGRFFPDEGLPPVPPLNFAASMRQGNIPNVFNIYGFLEHTAFGRARENEEGIPAQMIYMAIQSLLNSSTASAAQNFWSPYGGIITKSLSEFNTRNKQTTITDPKLINIGNFNAIDFGFMPHHVIFSNDPVVRPRFRFDLSSIPLPPPSFRIKGPAINLMDFVTTLCDYSGVDFFVDFIPGADDGGYSGTIKIIIIDRKRPARNKDVLNYIKEIEQGGVRVSNKTYGVESANSTHRTMYVGGKQKRLVQYKSERFHWKQHALVYDPFAKNNTGSFIDVPINATINYAKFPYAFSYRSQNMTNGAGVVIDPAVPGQITDVRLTKPLPYNFNKQPFDKFLGDPGNPDNIPQKPGNYRYDNTIERGLSNSTSIPIFNDVICPYFGKHFDGSIRKVYYDNNMGQLQILFKIQDLFVDGNLLDFTPELSLGINHFVVLENEIRAAGGGYEQWLSYCFDNGFTTDIEKLCYRALNRQLPTHPDKQRLQIASLFRNIIANIRNQVIFDPSANFGLNELNLYNIPNLYDSLKAIYNVFATIASTHYAKSYMVNMSNIKTYKDYNTTNIPIGIDRLGNIIYAIEGTGKTYYNYEPSKEGAWEEPGNVIDTHIVVGSSECSVLTNDENLIQPVLGFNTSLNHDGSTNNSLFNSYLSDHLNRLLRNINTLYSPITFEGISPSEHVTISIGKPVGNKDAHGYQNILTSKKTYIKCSVDEKIEYIIFDNQIYPKAIINLPAPVYHNSQYNTSSLAFNMVQDSLLRIMEANGNRNPPNIPPEVLGSPRGEESLSPFADQLSLIEAHFSRPNNRTKLGGLFPKIYLSLNPFGGLLGLPASQLALILGSLELTYLGMLQGSADAYENPRILNKARIPSFAALPVKYNQYVYGPWINYPAIDRLNIFGHDDLTRVENLVGGVKVEIQEDLVPWKYGSMTALDQAVMLFLNQDCLYEQSIETANIEIPAFLDEPLGKNLGNAVLNSVVTQVGPDGLKTSLSFRTYTRKLGLYNKENADRIKKINLESIKRNKEMMAKYNDLNERIKTGNVGSSQSFLENQDPKLLQWSPVEILVGRASTKYGLGSTITDPVTSLFYSPSWHMTPIIRTENFDAVNGGVVKQISRVNLQDYREAPLEFRQNYNTKSMMTLDGLLSPVSLYPTPFGGTYHITKYDQKICPICKGQKTYEYTYISNSKNAGRGLAQSLGQATTVTLICDFCEDKTKVKVTDSVSREQEPPYILTNKSDSTLLQNFQDYISNKNINLYSLNPILLINGEFSNPNKQIGDTSAHCIDAVSYGTTPPVGYGNNMRTISSTSIEDAYNSIDTKWTAASNSKVSLSNNHRFFALRGPIMLHSWGYDTEGFPVPNLADEPLLNPDGSLIRDENGDVVTKGRHKKGNSWSKTSIPSGQFYKGWGQLPSTWPVGPIDLRWDRDSKVWTVGNNYRPVFIILEEDLTDQQPARGTMLTNNINTDPLPDGSRKVVFVKDNKGISSPRGSKVYCRYNSKNGFYEPLFAGNNVTSGTILSSNTAKIYLAYSFTEDLKLSDVPTDSYTTSFINPLNYSINHNKLGIFNFINGSWVLQNIKEG